MNPVGFVFGVHLHQPVGNFDHVFADHLRDVYRPLVERLAERRFFPFTLHISGPLLEWLETHDAAYLDLIGRLAAEVTSSCCSRGSTSRCLRHLSPPIGSSRWRGCARRSGGASVSQRRGCGSPSECGSPIWRLSWPMPACATWCSTTATSS